MRVIYRHQILHLILLSLDFGMNTFVQALGN